MATPNPLPTVKQQWAAALAPLMPAKSQLDPDGTVRKVPVFYSYPGDDFPMEAVWFHGGDTVVGVNGMRANQRRRKLTVEFGVIVQVLLEQPNDEDPDASSPQAAADTRAYAIAAVIDDHISTDEHLASAALVDVAELVSQRLVYGAHDRGSWARIEMRVSFDARIL